MRTGTRTTTKGGMLGSALAAVAAALLVAPPVSAQSSTDGRWLPWLGCWESTGETGDDSLLCIRPAADETGVEITTLSDGVVKARETLAADGQARDRSREGCEGVETARFSDDAHRIYLTSDYTCEGGVQRSSTGLMAMVSPVQWIDVQTVDAGGRDVAWIQRYRLASAERAEEAGFGDVGAGRAMAIESGRVAAAAPAEVDDVVEASRHVSAAAVEAWITEQNDGFDLGAAELVRLADAGVDESVIDVMVAVSYPDHFMVDNGAERMAEDRDGASPWFGRRGWYGGGWYYDPFYYSPYYGYGYGYGYGWYGGYSPRVVIVQPREDVSRGGRMIRGRGYTRGRTGSSGSGGSPPSVSRPSGGTSGGTAAPSTGRPTGRKAKPRGGGSGGPS